MEEIKMRRIEKRIRLAVEEYVEKEQLQTAFAEPVVRFVSVSHPLFDTFFARGENDHPKNIWRPGNTLIVYHLPFAAAQTPETLPTAMEESRWLAMHVNAAIADILAKIGRIYSRCSTMMDWDHAAHRYSWSNELAGYLAGMGEFGPAGVLQMHADIPGFGGRIGTMLTDGVFLPKMDPEDADTLEQAFRDIQTASCFAGAPKVHCSDSMIAACPGAAIAEDGIDRAKCQAYCATLNEADPCPRMCGRCGQTR